MKIAIPQINYKAGDIDGNSEKILRAIRQAEKEKINNLPSSCHLRGTAARPAGTGRLHQRLPPCR